MAGMIGIDWGTTNLRAYRFDASGAVVARRSSPRGAATLTPDAFADVLVETVGDWRGDNAAPIVLAGMVGSRNGWREAPYLPCPVDPERLAAAALRLDTPIGAAVIVPGVSVTGPDTVPSVMRGEETQLFGAGIRDGLVVLPGTHSKWVTMQAGKIVDFATAMTGELYAVLRDHSLLGQLADPEGAFSNEAFGRGVRRTLAVKNIVPLLFSARAEVLLGSLDPQDVASYLSGILIGAEVGALARSAATLIGAPHLVDLYRTAFGIYGLHDVAIVDGDDAVARGLWQIGEYL
jgi:2-dehydro-3-deoxygalactonokinase